MIVVIGADGFLGKCVVDKLTAMPWKGRDVLPFHDITAFFDFLPAHYQEVDWIIYADKRDKSFRFNAFRMAYVQQLWTVAAAYAVPLVYAFYQTELRSEMTFQPDVFISWSEKQYRKPPYGYIFRLSEVYGPYDGMPGEESSRICSWCREIKETGGMTLASDATLDAGMCRDYVYVQDVVRVLYWFMVHLPGSGVYDVGSGFARTEEAVARAIFHAMKQEPVILYRTEQRESGTGDNPIFQPDLSRLRRTGYKKPFYSIEKGVKSYIQRYLEE